MKKADGDSYEPQPGDVDSVNYADPPNSNTRYWAVGRVPETDERVAIRLVGHPFHYIVRVATARGRDPRLTELTIHADDGGDIDHATLRAVPVRRLTYTAAQWIAREGGLIGDVDDIAETTAQPDNPAPPVRAAAELAEQALSLGLPVRPYVADKLGYSKTTVDRLLKRAKAEGWLDGQHLPKRPPPQQRDTTTKGNDR